LFQKDFPGADVKTILLLRHAKSDWGSPGLPDHDRPLNRRGERAAEAMAEYIARRCPRPDVILCSTALRTRQTLSALMYRLASPAPPIALEKGLYLASESTLFDRLQALSNEQGTVLLIGHNDGLWHLATALAGRGEPRLRATLAEKYPTASLSIFSSPAQTWEALAGEGTELVAFVRPRDLMNPPQ
jgi:phosphohistidine phosphatase